VLLGLTLLAGCAPRPRDTGRSAVAAGIRERSGFNIGAAELARPSGNTTGQPPSLAALREDHAVDLALRHNSAFHEQLTNLKLSWADVVQAGLVPNPDLNLLFALGPKQTEGTLMFPLEFLWLRGKRVGAARAMADQTSERLVQVAMDLIRDVRLAYADLALARERVALLTEAGELRGRVAELAAARVRAGDATPLDAVLARADALRAREEARRLEYDAAISEERLRALLGLGADRTPIALAALDSSGLGQANVDALVEQAVADRADARAAVLAVAAARERARLARVEFFTFSGIIDANERGSKGFEAGPGMRLALPVFNQNQGVVARADAELERAVRQQATLRDRIILDVREAHARFVQARQDLEAWRTQIRPAMEEAVRLSERAYRAGETPLVTVLEASRQLLDGRGREAQAASDLRRARAELERGVGRRIDAPPDARPAPTSRQSLPTEQSP
jgi:cobalt-zinc-cadmium efflux system outer membrane protein